MEEKSIGLSYLTEEENAIVEKTVRLFEEEYNGDLTKLDEGFFKNIVGGITGFLAGPSVGRIICKVLGIEKGVLYDLFTSRLVGTALGTAIAKESGNKCST